MRVILILIFTLSFILNTFGEDFFLTSKVNKNKIELGEKFEFIIEVKGNFRTTPQIEFPKLKDFEVLSRKSSYNFSMRENKFLNQTKFIFILEPKSEGKFLIGEVKVRYRGKEYKTEPIEILVSPKIKRPKKKFPQNLPKITL